jgi:hypothetical protein
LPLAVSNNFSDGYGGTLASLGVLRAEASPRDGRLQQQKAAADSQQSAAASCMGMIPNPQMA